jgi:formate hydrogenlyase subunit 4
VPFPGGQWRPLSVLKEKSLGPKGHLSNEQAAAFLSLAATQETKGVMLCHLSEDYNRPDIALRTVGQSLQKSGWAGALGAAALVPTVLSGDGVFHFGNLFALCYLLALGRFFLALASLDAGSTFGGMGGSRELFLSVLVEPVMMITLAVVAFQAHSTDAAVIARSAAASGVTISGILAAIAFMILTITETGRIPVDNPDTHLELTMLHEAMTLEYSGRSVALIFWASAVKQLVFILLMVNLFLPWGPAGVIAMCVKALVVAVALAAIETGTNKMRLFRLPAFLMFTGILALMAIIAL